MPSRSRCLHGATAKRERLLGRFGAIVGNWLELMSRTKKVGFFTTGADQAAVIFPYIVVGPAYFSGHGQLGVLSQTASAFDSVRSALSFFMDFYRSQQYTRWRTGRDRAIRY
jgi:putative ATP-binding cassette transporter